MAQPNGDPGDKPENDKPEDETPENDAPEDEDDDPEGEGDDKDEKDDKPKTDLQKAIERRDRALIRARKAEKALADAKAEKDSKDKPDPVAAANSRLVRTAAHGVLRGMGVEDKNDRAAVLDMLNLSDIDVDDDGADEEAIEDRIEQLRSIFAPKSTVPGRTVPKTVKSKQSTKETTTDPDKARYRRIMGGR